MVESGHNHGIQPYKFGQPKYRGGVRDKVGATWSGNGQAVGLARNRTTALKFDLPAD